MVMKIAAITRFKHGMLYEALKHLGWTQRELAKRSGIPMPTINTYLALKRQPSVNSARKLNTAFADAGYFFDIMAAWPKTFRSRKGGYIIEQIADVDTDFISDISPHALLDYESFQKSIDLNELPELMNALLPREKHVLHSRFIRQETLEHIGRRLKLTRERVRQIEGKALQSLRSAFNSKRPFELAQLQLL
jgi:RNA polymerase sigma factor (sigma-70 family)